MPALALLLLPHRFPAPLQLMRRVPPRSASRARSSPSARARDRRASGRAWDRCTLHCRGGWRGRSPRGRDRVHGRGRAHAREREHGRAHCKILQQQQQTARGSGFRPPF